jgi:hypothetical protein
MRLPSAGNDPRAAIGARSRRYVRHVAVGERRRSRADQTVCAHFGLSDMHVMPVIFLVISTTLDGLFVTMGAPCYACYACCGCVLDPFE